MGAVTASNITLISDDSIGTASMKRVGVKRRFSVVLSTQGATAGDMVDSMFGIASGRIFSVFPYRFVVSSADKAPPNVFTDGTNIFTAVVCDGSTAAANVSGTLYIQIEGDPT